jgi:hypothetical protein
LRNLKTDVFRTKGDEEPSNFNVAVETGFYAEPSDLDSTSSLNFERRKTLSLPSAIHSGVLVPAGT